MSKTIKNRELLKENCYYKLHLINLIENFEQELSKTNDKYVKRYITEMKRYLERTLQLEEKNDEESLIKLMKEEKDE